MSESAAARRFWDDIIEAWDSGRYELDGKSRSIVERIANGVSTSVRFRMVVAGQALSAVCRDRRIVELGCGTGRLAPLLVANGVAQYTGYDISPRAIELARQRATAQGIAGKAEFHALAIEDLPVNDADIVFSLGLFDWLTLGQIERYILAKSGQADFLHSFSERRVSLQQYIHRAYTRLAYAGRPAGQVPEYLSEEALMPIARRHCARAVALYRNPRLRFGTFLTTLPIGE